MSTRAIDRAIKILDAGSGNIPKGLQSALFRSRKEKSDARKKKCVLRKVLKSGKLGTAQEYEYYGGEKTPQDVIERMEKNNPGHKWVEA